MALQAGRVGVRPDQVDLEGRVKGAGSDLISVIDEITNDISDLSKKISNSYITGKSTQTITFSDYRTVALITISDGLYTFNNGYLNVIKSTSNIEISLDDVDYTKITIKNNVNSNHYIGIINMGASTYVIE